MASKPCSALACARLGNSRASRHIVPKVASCSKIFVGERAPGVACERNAQCAPAELDSDAGGCFEGTCSVVHFIPEGESCDVTATTAFCDYRLYCNADVANGVFEGTGQAESAN